MISDGSTSQLDLSNGSQCVRRAETGTKKPHGRATAVTPALAFGTGLTALGVLRSLRAAGVPVYSVCPRDDLAAKSRWFRPAPLTDGAVPDPPQLAQYLEALSLPGAVLVPCSDDWSRAIAELSGPLKERFPASVPDARVVDTMTDKWQFSTFIECVGIPRPKSLRVDSLSQLESLPDSDYEDMFFKPVDSQEFARRNNVKAFRFKNKRHALEIMEGIVENGGAAFPILLQEYIPGPPSHYFLVDGFVDAGGVIRALVARRRLNQYPPFFGNSSRSEMIPLQQVQEAVRSIEAMWSAVRYRGIFDAEFKYDDRDGHLKILEVNPRPWWFVEFATRCGVDLCGMYYRDALGQPVEAVSGYDVGRRCVYLSYDLASHLNETGGARGVLRWLRSARNIEDIIYRWDDPWPGLHATWSAVKNYRKHRPQTG